MSNAILNTTKIISVSILFSIMNNALAAESVTSTATVTVQNAFTFAEISALNFGTIRAQAVATSTANGKDQSYEGGGVDYSVYILPSDGVATVDNSSATDSVIETLVPGAPGSYTVTGVVPYSSLELTLPVAEATVANPAIKLVDGGAPLGAYFLLYDFEATVTSGTSNGTAYNAGASNLTADGSGNASFTLGAKLGTSDPSGTRAQIVYQDTAYTGNYIIIVSY